MPERQDSGGRTWLDRAGVHVGDANAEVPVEPGAKDALLRVSLPAGMTRMRAFFLTRSTVGASYAYVRWP